MRKLDDFTVFRFDVVYDEIITVSQKRAFRIGTVVGVDSIVNRIAGFGGVKLTRIAIFVTAVIVVDTISDVACLPEFPREDCLRLWRGYVRPEERMCRRVRNRRPR